MESEGGNIKFKGEDESELWFAIDKGKKKTATSLPKDAKGFYNLLVPKEGLDYCMVIGETNEYEPYKEQIVSFNPPVRLSKWDRLERKNSAWGGYVMEKQRRIMGVKIGRFGEKKRTHSALELTS